MLIQLRRHQQLVLGNVSGKDSATNAGTTVRMFYSVYYHLSEFLVPAYDISVRREGEGKVI